MYYNNIIEQYINMRDSTVMSTRATLLRCAPYYLTQVDVVRSVVTDVESWFRQHAGGCFDDAEGATEGGVYMSREGSVRTPLDFFFIYVRIELSDCRCCCFGAIEIHYDTRRTGSFVRSSAHAFSVQLRSG